MTRSVLVVDDDPDARMLASLSLSAFGGFSVETADGGAAALERLAVSRPDVVLLDVMMPDISGPETLARMREAAAWTVPVIFCTARSDPGEIESLISLGALGVVVKPFDPVRLAARVAEILDERAER